MKNKDFLETVIKFTDMHVPQNLHVVRSAYLDDVIRR